MSNTNSIQLLVRSCLPAPISRWFRLSREFLSGKNIFTLLIATLMFAVTSQAQTPGTWIATGSMNTARSFATATLLNNGKVLVAGGRDASYTPTNSVELYDPGTGTWTLTGSMSTARTDFTATMLPNGKVLVAGGQSCCSIPLSSAEIYDPDSATWSPTGSLNHARNSQLATLLPDGLVLITGGLDENYGSETSAELYDPGTGVWSNTGSMAVARFWDPPSSATLPDGSILIVGGTTCCPYHWINEAEIYDPVSETWTATSNKTTPAKDYAVLLPDGTVLVAGGSKGTQPNVSFVAKAELFDPSTGTWTATGSMSTDRADHTLTLLPNGIVLVAGGASGGWGVCNDLITSELYDQSTGNWSLTGDMIAARHNHTATLLPNGQVLAAGGANCAGTALTSAELYTPYVISPIASSDTSVCEKFCVDFYDYTGNNATLWQWIFPGGTPDTSSLQNPTTICYNSPGTYDVTLITTNAGGNDTLTLSDYITVNAAPVAVITQSNDTLYSSLGNSYQWYANGNGISGATNFFYVPSSADFYSVEITDSNGCSAADTIFFAPAPFSNFSSPNPTVCEKFCVDFIDQSTNNPTSWQWIFPGGTPASSIDESPTNICYNNPGSYDVTLITTNTFGSDTLTLPNYITVNATPPFPVIMQLAYTLISSPAFSYQWQFNSADIPGATNQVYNVLQTGYYTVIISDTNGCVNSASLYLLIDGISDVAGDSNFSIYPNPFSTSTTISFLLTQSGNVTMKIFDAEGRLIRTLVADPDQSGRSMMSAGIHEITWDARDENGHAVSVGLYFLKIETASESETIRLSMMK